MTITAPLGPPPHAGAAASTGHTPTSVPDGVAPARSILVRYALTIGALAAGLIGLLIVWSLVSTTGWAASHPWPTAAITAAGWAVAVTTCLRRQGWATGMVHAATWVLPAAALIPLFWAGWLFPAGLVLWAPMTTLFTVALAMAYRPLPADRSRR